MKTIMLCLNQLGIGGVETAVLNQTIQLIRKEYRVIILAKDGIYRKKFEEEGAIFIEADFVVQNQYDIEKIKKIMDIIEQYKVEQVHIHQFDCINTVFPACILKRIPYVAYAHTGITGIYDWFEKSYVCYPIMFKLYFESAEKIIAITESAKQENREKYNIPSEKYIVMKNSIDFERFKVEENKIPEKVENFLIISRLSNEKLVSIKNSILIFKDYYQKNSEAKLTIVGDGECRNLIEKEIEEIKEAVFILGEKSNIAEIISQNDVVMGVDRCILEAVTMKKIAIISGYESIKGMVTPENINNLAGNNFSGKELKEITIQELEKELEGLDKEKIRRIVEENYQYAFENLNASKNIYLIQNSEKEKTGIKNDNAMNAIIELQNLYANHLQYTDKVYKDCKEEQKWYEGQIKLRDIEIENKQKQIEELNQKLSQELEKRDKWKKWMFHKK